MPSPNCRYHALVGLLFCVAAAPLTAQDDPFAGSPMAGGADASFTAPADAGPAPVLTPQQVADLQDPLVQGVMRRAPKG